MGFVLVEGGGVCIHVVSPQLLSSPDLQGLGQEFTDAPAKFGNGCRKRGFSAARVLSLQTWAGIGGLPGFPCLGFVCYCVEGCICRIFQVLSSYVSLFDSRIIGAVVTGDLPCSGLGLCGYFNKPMRLIKLAANLHVFIAKPPFST